MLRILWLNWRDIKNPDSGGAEVLIHQIMKGLKNKGYENTLFTSRYPDCQNFEIIDDTKIIRNGGKYTVYEKARHYFLANSEKYDLIVDSINTKPFLTPKYVAKKHIIALFYQLAKEFWFYETRFPVNLIGYYFLENRWLSHYRNIPTVTISNSSRCDLVKAGFKKIFNIRVGLSVKPISYLAQKESAPTFIFIGRLKKAKRPDHALKAFSIIKEDIPEARMWVVGDGYMKKNLENLDLKDVVFYGRVSNEMKYNLLQKAHLSLVPGVREGWGLVVTESNSMGTPAVAYNVPGLRDSIIDGQTGILTRESSPQSLAQSAIFLLKNGHLLNQISNNALNFSRSFNWNSTADEFDRIIKDVTLAKIR